MMSCCYPGECCEMVPAGVTPVFGPCCPDPYCPEPVCYSCLPACPRPHCCPPPCPRPQPQAMPHHSSSHHEENTDCCYEREYSPPPRRYPTPPRQYSPPARQRRSKSPRCCQRSPPPRRQTCRSPEPPCCQITMQPVKTKYVIPCYRYEDGRISNQPTLLMRRACEVATGRRARRPRDDRDDSARRHEDGDRGYGSDRDRPSCCFADKKKTESSSCPFKAKKSQGHPCSPPTEPCPPCFECLYAKIVEPSCCY